ncbi:MAG TPA: hypothetical protein VHL58_10565 [Thermoanaerobaculia bacterium]|nr:hypothetical protein [Thermoanaerobaculia bacterium]
MRKSTLALLALFAFAFSFARVASAAVYVVPQDGVMVRGASGIVVGTVYDSRSELTSEGRLHTVVDLAVEESLKGRFEKGQMLEVSELGGEWNGSRWAFAGVPAFQPGDRVLFFMEKNRYHEWTTYQIGLGSFWFDVDQNGRKILTREVDQICGWDGNGQTYRDLPRDAVRFVQFIRDVAVGAKGSDSTYMLERSCPLHVAAKQIPVSANATASSYLAFMVNGNFARWKTFTPPSETITFKAAGSQPGLDGPTAASKSVSVWTDDSASTVQYVLGGTSTATCIGFGVDGNAPKCGGVSGNVILFNDPADEIPGTFNGSGVVAIGGPFISSETYPFSGETFARIVQGDAVVQSGIGGFLSQAFFEAAVAHEIGHTLGFRHSNEGTPLAANALMASVVNNGPGTATLLSWDQDAVRTVYGNGAVCSNATITQQPQSQTVGMGQTATLSVGVSGTPPFTYQWFQVNTGNTTTLIQGATSSSFTTPPLNAPTSYWVRVTNCSNAGSVDSVTATIGVNCGPVITNISNSITILSGTSATLSVTATGQAPLTYQWFTGLSGNTVNLIAGATSSTLDTGNLTQTTSFWVRVSGGCAPSANSPTITITVCNGIQILTQPQDQQVTAGLGASLVVEIMGSPSQLFFQWFRGVSGNTSSPVGTGQVFNTGALNNTTQFWVRVSNSCSVVNSATATVTVMPQCVPPAITGQPQPATVMNGQTANLTVAASGTALVYQWFLGMKPDMMRPVGVNSPMLTTPALTVNSMFWVRVSNSCGFKDSDTVVVTVITACMPASVVFSPKSVTAQPGQNVTLTGMGAGTSPLAFQWFTGSSGNTASPIPGATTSTLTVTNIRVTTSFWLQVRNSCGMANSSTATVTVGTGRPRAVRR